MVREGHKIGFDGAFICLLQARGGEWTRDKETGCGIRLWRRLVRMQRTAVVFGRTELIPARRQESFSTPVTLYRVPILDDFSLGRRGGEGRRVLQVGDRIRGGRGRGIAATDGPDGAQAGARIVPEGAAQAYAELAEGQLAFARSKCPGLYARFSAPRDAIGNSPLIAGTFIPQQSCLRPPQAPSCTQQSCRPHS